MLNAIITGPQQILYRFSATSKLGDRMEIKMKVSTLVLSSEH